jgi:hypothetical protein
VKNLRRAVSVAVLPLLVAFVTVTFPYHTAAVEQEPTVYATKTGSKYHAAGCRSLSKSKIPMKLSDAAQKYGACSICKPPVPSRTTPSEPTPSEVKPTKPPPSAPRSSQCAATTKKGARCSRNAAAGSAYCWQHGLVPR